MHGNEVVDLQKFREGDAGKLENAETGEQYLPSGTTLLVGQYIIDGYLNCGGFGITYTARDSLGRKVVIKECFPSEMVYRKGKSMASRSPKYQDELKAIVRNFVTEAHSLANVKHDNIVHVHQIFEENRTAYIAMDYIDAPDLLDVLESNRKLSPKEVQSLTRKMLEAIGYLHRLGMLHRDISPDNIMLQSSGAPVLIDFGAARQMAKNGPQASAKMKFVKDGYSPQEFYVAGSEQGTFSDLYSFAASIHHVITGAAPVDAQSRLAALAAKKPDPYKPLADSISGYPTGFLKALDKALAVLPKDRMQTAQDWLDAIDASEPAGPAALFKPVTAVLESLSIFDEVTGSDEWTPRSKKPFLAAGMAGLALLLGGGVLWMQMSGSEAPEARLASIAVEATPPQLARLADLPQPLVMRSVWPDGFSSGLDKTAAETQVASASTRAPARLALVDTLPLPAPRIGVTETATLDRAFKAPPAPLSALPEGLAVQPDAAFAAVTHGFQTLFDVPMARPPQKAPLSAPDLAGANQTSIPSTDIAVTAIAPVALTGRVDTLPEATRPHGVTVDTSAPIYTPSAGQLLETSFSRWVVDLPFATTAERSGEMVIHVLSPIKPSPGRATNDWIAEGTAIVAINGKPFQEGEAFADTILESLKIDEDGLTRVGVWVRQPGEDVLDQLELVLPVVRRTGLADGTLLETRKQGESWVTRVAALGSADTQLRIGDLIVGNTATSGRFSDHTAVETALSALAQSGATAAEFSVLRNGQRLTASWQIAGQ
jgi:serine/threonine protein kinase